MKITCEPILNARPFTPQRVKRVGDVVVLGRLIVTVPTGVKVFRLYALSVACCAPNELVRKNARLLATSVVMIELEPKPGQVKLPFMIFAWGSTTPPAEP